MLGSGPELRFPKLVHVGYTTLTAPKQLRVPIEQAEDAEIALYRLDWTDLEAWRRLEHERWVTRNAKKEYPYQEPLPEPYAQQLAAARFAIRPEYYGELARNGQRAAEEWRVYRPFDTAVREMCLGPAMAHVEVAVDLLMDCLFDEGRLEFAWRRHGHKMILESSILWLIWYRQTGGGLLWKRARLDDLQSRWERLRRPPTVLMDHGTHLREVVSEPVEEEPASLVADFVAAMRVHRERASKARHVAMDEE